MKVLKEGSGEGFKPISIIVTVESREEQDILQDMCKLDIRVPSYVIDLLKNEKSTLSTNSFFKHGEKACLNVVTKFLQGIYAATKPEAKNAEGND